MTQPSFIQNHENDYQLAQSPQDYQTIETLAREIMPEVYVPDIPLAHVHYYLETFQTSDAIHQQIRQEHYVYFILYFNEQAVGYLGMQLLKDVLLLSKLYILKEYRGNKIGKKALELAEQMAKGKLRHRIELYVYKNNEASINIYKKAGYVIEALTTHTYDNGHTEENYLMAKQLSL